MVTTRSSTSSSFQYETPTKGPTDRSSSRGRKSIRKKEGTTVSEMRNNWEKQHNYPTRASKEAKEYAVGEKKSRAKRNQRRASAQQMKPKPVRQQLFDRTNDEWGTSPSRKDIPVAGDRVNRDRDPSVHGGDKAVVLSRTQGKSKSPNKAIAIGQSQEKSEVVVGGGDIRVIKDPREGVDVDVVEPVAHLIEADEAKPTAIPVPKEPPQRTGIESAGARNVTLSLAGETKPPPRPPADAATARPSGSKPRTNAGACKKVSFTSAGTNILGVDEAVVPTEVTHLDPGPAAAVTPSNGSFVPVVRSSGLDDSHVKRGREAEPQKKKAAVTKDDSTGQDGDKEPGGLPTTGATDASNATEAKEVSLQVEEPTSFPNLKKEDLAAMGQEVGSSSDLDGVGSVEPANPDQLTKFRVRRLILTGMDPSGLLDFTRTQQAIQLQELQTAVGQQGTRVCEVQDKAKSQGLALKEIKKASNAHGTSIQTMGKEIVSVADRVQAIEKSSETAEDEMKQQLEDQERKIITLECLVDDLLLCLRLRREKDELIVELGEPKGNGGELKTMCEKCALLRDKVEKASTDMDSGVNADLKALLTQLESLHTSIENMISDYDALGADLQRKEDALRADLVEHEDFMSNLQSAMAWAY